MWQIFLQRHMLKTTWRCSKSISTGAQYVTLDNKIKCLSFAVFFFGNPTNKTVIGTEYMWGLLIANHLDQSLWSANQKRWSESDHICYTLFCRCTALLRLSPASAQFCGAKTIFLGQTSIFWIFFIHRITYCNKVKYPHNTRYQPS